MRHIYRPQTKLREGNVSQVSVCPRRGAGGLSTPVDGYTRHVILRDTVDKRAVRILLECILVHFSYTCIPERVLLDVDKCDRSVSFLNKKRCFRKSCFKQLRKNVSKHLSCCFLQTAWAFSLFSSKKNISIWEYSTNQNYGNYELGNC